MIEAQLIPLPLAEADDVIKVVVGLVFAAIWIIAQIAASAGSKGKKQRQMQQMMQGDAPLTTAAVATPPDTQLERQLRQRREQAQRHRAGLQPHPGYPQAMPPGLPQPQSYDEMRRLLQQQQSQQQFRPQFQQPYPGQQTSSRPPQQGKRRRDRKPDARPARAAAAPSPLFEEIVEPSVALKAGEIGSEGDKASRRASRSASAARVRALLKPRTVRDIVVAAELLRPPVSLRQ